MNPLGDDAPKTEFMGPKANTGMSVQAKVTLALLATLGIVGLVGGALYVNFSPTGTTPMTVLQGMYTIGAPTLGLGALILAVQAIYRKITAPEPTGIDNLEDLEEDIATACVSPQTKRRIKYAVGAALITALFIAAFVGPYFGSPVVRSALHAHTTLGQNLITVGLPTLGVAVVANLALLGYFYYKHKKWEEENGLTFDQTALRNQ